MIAVGKIPMIGEWIVASRLIDVGGQVVGGKVVVENLDGTVMSVQPDGRIESRPAGSAGAYEQATIVGNNLAFRPVSGKVYVFPYISEIP